MNIMSSRKRYDSDIKRANCHKGSYLRLSSYAPSAKTIFDSLKN